ncbi:mitochondrial carrier domain-containing protein [Syncephalis fuscata]|nr:mitochondrial carrier domain-containing protein [Syncephalis fuscata]
MLQMLMSEHNNTTINTTEWAKTSTAVADGNLSSTASSQLANSPLNEYYYKAVSACAGALITSLLVTPLDVVKTRLQSQPVSTNIAKELPCRYNHTACLCPPRITLTNVASLYKSKLLWAAHKARMPSSHASSSRPIRGTWHGLFTIMRHEGATTLWRGLVPTLAMSLPATIMYYVGYDQLRELLSNKYQNSSQIQYVIPLVAGGTMRAATATVISPMELVRTRMQSYGESRNLRGVVRDVRQMTQREGLRSLWRGLAPTLWRDVPFSAVYWLGYESIKKALVQNNYRETTSIFNEFQYAFIAGATSGMIAAIVTTPFDVIKTRIQTHQYNASYGHSQVKLSQVMRDIVYREGWAGLTRGMVARVVKIAPSCAVMIGTYELGKQWLIKDKKQ